MRVLLTGARGQLARDLLKQFSGHEVIAKSHEELDVTNLEQVRQAVTTHEPQVIINTAAFHKVDICETQVLPSFEVNACGVRNLAVSSRETDSVLVHFSTDYVFDGTADSPYTEMNTPNPISVYGVSKLAGEKLVGCVWEKCFVIRTCGLYGQAGDSGKGGNFVETMLKKAGSDEEIRVVDDQRLTPTSTRELARKVSELVQTKDFGLYHITADGECSWYEFAREIFALQGIKARLFPTTSKQFKTAARRPAYSVLANSRLKQLGMDDLKDWRTALEHYLSTREN